jgi:hypothetical protein
MRKLTLSSLLIVGLVLAVTAQTPVAEKTITGEVIDVACNTKSVKSGGNGTSAANHADCSLLCVSKGMPAGIKAADDVYIVVGDYTTNDNKALLQFVNKQVKATGTVKVIDGRKTITLKQIDLLPASK